MGVVAVKTGILGGTFDPPHNAHLAIAEEAKRQLRLSEVLFLPAGQPWMKSGHPISSAVHRLEMTRLAIEGRPHFKVSTIEIERTGLSYSVDTLTELKARSGEASEFYFIIGWDGLTQLPHWKNPLKLMEMCFFVAVSRPGCTRPDLKALEAKIPGISGKVILLEEPSLDISATNIRQRVRQGLPISHLVPETVEKYIKENGLYLRG